MNQRKIGVALLAALCLVGLLGAGGLTASGCGSGGSSGSPIIPAVMFGSGAVPTPTRLVTTVTGAKYAAGQLVAQFAPGTTSDKVVAVVSAAVGGTATIYQSLGSDTYTVVVADSTDVPALAAKLATDASVKSAQPNYVVGTL